MSYQVLARRWRPQVFEDVVGQDHITRTLINAIKENRVAQAYLFCGPRGVGKTSVARIFAKAINCESGQPGIPCNKCTSCIQITEGTSVDVQEIDGASNRRIEEIRELRENIKYLPSHSKYRIYIIDEVHMLTKEAFNALLKTLEEPPEHAKFIFATTEPHKVPLTILSRCQRFDFKRIPISLMVEHLRKITDAEKIKITESALILIARQAEGSMRDAESLLDQVISFAGRNISEKDVINALGILDNSIVFDLAQAIIQGSSKKALKIIDKVYNHGYDIKVFYRMLMEHFRNLMVCTIDPALLDVVEEEIDNLCNQANLLGTEQIQFILNFLLSKEQELMFTYNPRLFVETIIIRLCNIKELFSFNDLIKRLEDIEKRWALFSDKKNLEIDTDKEEKRVERLEKEEKTEKEEKEEEKEKDWDGFLEFVSQKNKPMYNVMKGWSLEEISGNVIKIRPDNKGFSVSYFKQKDSYEALKSYIKEYFGLDLMPKLVISKQRQKKKAQVSGPVQELLNIFQGKIIEEHKKEENHEGIS